MSFDYFWIGALFLLFAGLYPRFFMKDEENSFKDGYSFGMGLAGIMIFVIRLSEWFTHHLHFSFSWN